MASVYEILSTIKDEDMVTYMMDKLKSTKESSRIRKYSHDDCLDLVRSIKSLPIGKSDFIITDVIVFEDERLVDPSYSTEVLAYKTEGGVVTVYDIADEKWEDILGTEVSECSLKELLPIEVVGDVLLRITANHTSSPTESHHTLVVEDSSAVSRGALYKAFGVKDDRTKEEKEYDTKMYNYMVITQKASFMKRKRLSL